MDRLDGDLSVIRPQVTDETWCKICEMIKTQIICIAITGHYYTDIKAENTLYKLRPDGMISVHLGDLGSVRPTANGYITTYPPPEYKGREIHINTPEEASKLFAWSIGVLFLSKFTAIDVFYWGNMGLFPDNIPQQRALIHHIVAHSPPRYNQMLNQLLDPDPTTRPSLGIVVFPFPCQ